MNKLLRSSAVALTFVAFAACADAGPAEPVVEVPPQLNQVPPQCILLNGIWFCPDDPGSASGKSCTTLNGVLYCSQGETI